MPLVSSVWSRFLLLLVVAAVLAVVVGAVVPAVVRAQSGGQDQSTRTCLANVKHLAAAITMYAQDNGQRFPLAKNWCGAVVRRYAKKTEAFKCPKAAALSCGYAYNANLSGQRLMSVPKPKDTVLLFECDKGWNAAGDGKLLPKSPRHGGGDVVAFADGHAQWLPRAQAAKLKWKPR